MPRGAATGSFGAALGVGGFVTDVPKGYNSFDLRSGNRKKYGSSGQPDNPIVPGLLNIEPDKVGGSKMYVHPRSASIDPKGRVILNVVAAEPEAVSVHERTVGNIPVEQQRPMASRTTGFSKTMISSDKGYGLGGFSDVAHNNRSIRSSGADIDNAAFQELSNLLSQDQRQR
jgi:hypothetical protein